MKYKVLLSNSTKASNPVYLCPGPEDQDLKRTRVPGGDATLVPQQPGAERPDDAERTRLPIQLSSRLIPYG